MSTGLGPSAPMIRSRSLCAISGRGSGDTPCSGADSSGPNGSTGRAKNRRQSFDDVAGAGNEASALLEQIVGAGGARVERAARHGKDLAALLGKAGGDQRAGPLGGLHHHDPERDAGDQAVAAREVLAPRGKARTALAQQEPLFAD